MRALTADGMILDDFAVHVHHHHCLAYEGASDFVVDVTASGNAIRWRPRTVAGVGVEAPAVRTVIHLDENGEL
jgi:hypothetical protein